MNCTQCGASAQSSICSYCSSVLSGDMPSRMEKIGKFMIDWNKVALVDLSWPDRVLLRGSSGDIIVGIYGEGAEMLKRRFGE